MRRKKVREWVKLTILFILFLLASILIFTYRKDIRKLKKLSLRPVGIVEVIK